MRRAERFRFWPSGSVIQSTIFTGVANGLRFQVRCPAATPPRQLSGGAMQKRKLGSCGREVSAVGLACMPMRFSSGPARRAAEAGRVSPRCRRARSILLRHAGRLRSLRSGDPCPDRARPRVVDHDSGNQQAASPGRGPGRSPRPTNGKRCFRHRWRCGADHRAVISLSRQLERRTGCRAKSATQLPINVDRSDRRRSIRRADAHGA